MQITNHLGLFQQKKNLFYSIHNLNYDIPDDYSCTIVITFNTLKDFLKKNLFLSNYAKSEKQMFISKQIFNI